MLLPTEERFRRLRASDPRSPETDPELVADVVPASAH